MLVVNYDIGIISNFRERKNLLKLFWLTCTSQTISECYTNNTAISISSDTRRYGIVSSDMPWLCQTLHRAPGSRGRRPSIEAPNRRWTRDRQAAWRSRRRRQALRTLRTADERSTLANDRRILHLARLWSLIPHRTSLCRLLKQQHRRVHCST